MSAEDRLAAALAAVEREIERQERRRAWWDNKAELIYIRRGGWTKEQDEYYAVLSEAVAILGVLKRVRRVLRGRAAR